MKDKGHFEKGHNPWNKGKRIKLDLEKINQDHWKKEKSILEIAKELNVSDRLIRLRLQENNFNIRKKTEPPKRIRDKIKRTLIRKGIKPTKPYTGKPTKGCFKKDNNPWNKNKKGLQKSNKKGKNYEEIYGEEKSKQYKKIIRKAREKQIFPLNDTQIEIKIQDFLKELNIKFIAHKQLSEIRHSYQCDIFIPIQERFKKIIIIEADGCYWHGCPICNKESSKQQRKQTAKDNRRTKELAGQGYKVLRLWEHEIKIMNLNNFKNKLNSINK